MSRKQKKVLVRILISAALWIACYFPIPQPVALALYLVSYAVIGWDVLWKAVRNILRGQVFDENFLMALATVGAMGSGEFGEGVAVMLFYQTGELFQSYAVGRSRKSIAELMDIRPDYANLEKDEGALEQVSPEEVQIGQTIVVKPGERVPLDGVILSGESSLDTKALSGESMPRSVLPGDDVVSGCVNLTGLLRVQVTRPFGESTVNKILELVENSSSKKARAENFISKFARYYTPAVVIAAVLMCVMAPLLGGDFSEWFHRALTFLVISCPCALVISIPLSFFGGIGGASKCGILVKGGNYLEALADVDRVVFDKTGTLTRGVFNVTAIHPDEISESRLLEIAAVAESYSDHPIARSLREAYGVPIDASRLSGLKELSGRGLSGLVGGEAVLVGNDRLMEENGIHWHPCHHVGTTVHVALEGRYVGHIVISDEIKPDAVQAISRLKAMGIRKTVMLTGDAKATGEDVAKRLRLDEVYTQLLPADKVNQVEALLSQGVGRGKLAFVGDGINDAPVLSRSDIGIAMGGMGSDAAIEAADVVLMDDQPSKIATAIAIARKTRRIVYENIVFALGVKAVVLILGAMGMASMWAAVFADVGVSFIAILNATRALKVPQTK